MIKEARAKVIIPGFRANIQKLQAWGAKNLK